MAVDAGIYGQVQQPQQVNPLNALAQAYQVKGLQSQLERGDREAAQQNRLLELVQSPTFAGLPTAQKAAALQGVGAFDQASKVVTTEATANKDQRAADVSSFELQSKKLDMLSNLAGSVTDQPSYDRARQIAQQQGLDVSKWNPQYDPAGVAQFAQATLSAKERLNAQIQQQGQQITRQNNIDTNATSRANNADTIANSARTANMTDARSREANANGRVPSGYRQAGDGALEFIPGGPADPAAAKKASPTEFQGKSATYGARAQEADRLITDLTGNYSPTGINFKQAVGEIPLLGGISSASANAALSENSQKAEQAQRDFVNAVLRQESGAAIGKDEFDNAKKQYFPQPGDGKEVIAQKAANRKLVVQGFMNNAGNAPVAAAPAAQAAKASVPTRKVIGGKTYENDGKGWYVVN